MNNLAISTNTIHGDNMMYFKKSNMNSIVDSINEMLFSKCLKTNIEKKDNSYEIYCEVPGITKDQIDITLSNDTIYIYVNNEHDDNNKEYLIKERCITSMRREFHLDNIDPNGISADLNDGILHIKVSILDDNPHKRIDIE